MTLLRNNFDGGPDGTTITAANSDDIPGNDAFNTIGGPTGTGVVCQYSDNFARPTAEFTSYFKTAAVASAPCVGWSTSMGSQNQIYFREYLLYNTAFPTGGEAIFECDNGAVYCAFLAMSQTGEISALNSPQTVQNVFTTSAILDNWFRLEGRIQFSATTGNYEIRLYMEADSDTPTETISATNQNLGAASANNFLFGYAFGATNLTPMYVSGLELNNTGWPGPAPFKNKGVPGILTNPVAIHVDTR